MTSTNPQDTDFKQPGNTEPESENPNEITDRDLVFDCPYCDWNFVIDQQYAGRSFPCPKCGRNLDIPALDDSEEQDSLEEECNINETDGRVLQLQHELNQAHEEISTLKTEVEELRFRRRYLEKDKAEHARLLEGLNEQLLIMRASLDQMTESLRSSEKNIRDTQQIG